MRFIPTGIPEVIVVDLDVVHDDRGFFVETFRQNLFAESGIAVAWVQDNHSRSTAGVLRGLHFQDRTAPMAKLVRCTVGAVYDVAVDLRPASPTFGRWVGVELSAANGRCLYVPVGFGHGFVVRSDAAEIQYKCSGYYTPEAEGAVIWNDADLAIDWGVRDPIVSARDAAASSFAAYRRSPAF